MQSQSSDQRGFHGPQEAGASLCCWQPAASLQQLCSRQGRDELAAAPRQDPSGRQRAPAAPTLWWCRQRGLPGPSQPKRRVPGSRVPSPRQGTRGRHFPVHSSLSQGCPGVWGGPSNTWEHAGRNKATLAPRAEQYHIFTVKNMPRTQAERQHRKQLTQQTFHQTKPCFSIRTWFVPALFNTTRML